MRTPTTLAFLVVSLGALVGCGAGGPGGSGGIGADSTGADSTLEAGLSVQLSATHTSGNQVSDMANIFVSVSAVAAHAAGGGWQGVSDTPVVVDLLRLADSAEELGFAHLPAGRITQIRLYVADDLQSHAITNGGDDRPLRVPSGFQSGVKLKGPFDLGECQQGVAIGVIDLEKSIHIHGRGAHDDWTLRPTIHKAEYETADAACDPGAGGHDDDDGDAPGGDDTPGDDDGTDPGTDPGACTPGSEGCADPGSDPGTDPSGDGTGTDPGTDPSGDGTGTDPGTGADAGDTCPPVLNEAGGLVNSCTGNPIVS